MIQRRTPLKRTPLRKVSKKRAKESRIYTQKRKAFLQAHPWCQVWLMDHRPIGVTGPNAQPVAARDQFRFILCPPATDIHHTKGRTGSNYLDESTWLAVSREMHTKIHDNPSWARERGYLLT